MNKITETHPKVFVSYSYDSQEHKDWVLKLSTHLRGHGVDVILDQWDARLGDDLPFFMEQGLTNSHLVLCVCSAAYVQKANANKGGVGYEKKILTADLMKNSSVNYIIPIRRNNLEGTMPIFLGATKYADFSDDSKYYDAYFELLERIYGVDCSKKPASGENPFQSNKISRDITRKIVVEQIQYHNPSFCGHIAFDYTKNDGKYIIGVGQYMFVTKWSTAGMGSIHCYRDGVKRLGYNAEYTELPTKDDIVKFDFTSRYRTVNEGQIVILENDNNKFVAIKVTKVFRNTVDSGHLVEFDYKIYQEIDTL